MKLFKRHRRVAFHLFGPIIFSALLSSPLLSQYTTASLAGTVMDQSGAVVAEATVTIQNIDTGMKRVVTTVQSGSYLFPALPVGSYRLTINKLGFSTYTQE